MDLIRFHSNVKDREEEDVVEQLSRAVSFDALSSPDSLGSSVGDTLRADQIHHNMFQDQSDLDHKTYLTFAFQKQLHLPDTLTVSQ